MPHLIEGTELPPRHRVAIVVSRWNESITQRLCEGAVEELAQFGIEGDDVEVAWVPGAWEIPLVAEDLASTHEFDAIICLGCVIRGETTHDEHINRCVSDRISEIALKRSISVLMGILTVPNRELAEARAGGAKGNKGVDCARAAVEMMKLRKAIFDYLPQ